MCGFYNVRTCVPVCFVMCVCEYLWVCNVRKCENVSFVM